MKQRFLSLFLLGTLAACQSPQSMPQIQAPQRLQSMSTSRNNVSPQSYEGVRQGVIQLRRIRFDKWDLNQDGRLTRDEVSDRNLTMPLGLIKGFNDYDDNRDGQITFQEFLKERVITFWMDLYLSITEDEFFIIDDNQDGLLTGFEKEPARQLFARWPELNGGDLDKDGTVTFSEYQDAYMKVAPHLNKTSRNIPQS